MRRILVLRGGALGDFIVTLPALAALRKRWPAARIELAGNATAAQLARHRGLLDAVHSQHEGRWSALFDPVALPAEFGAWLTEFDLIVSFWPDADGALRGRFPLRPGQVFLSADALPARGPAAAHYCAPLRAVGIETAETWFPLQRESRRSAPTAPRSATISIHPGSGSPRKNWPMENWIALIPQLPPPVTLILGEAEHENGSGDALAARLARIAPKMPTPVTTLVQPPLEELVAHLSSCALFLGHDSGVSHLAAAAGARCVLLFGPTDSAIWAPPAPRVRVIQRGPDLSAISIAAVLQAVAAALADQT